MENETCRAAAYLRLSREEGDKTESDSIVNQRGLIREYVKSRPEIEIVKEYSDDGFSGSNFDRPGFKQMMEDAGAGMINCIIVKDLSRFGRNYIDTGRYLERIFPMMRIRFIAINDNYDSFTDNSEADQLLIPFKNLINDAYCRDISVKIRSQLEVKRRNGECLSGYAVYGYLKDPEDRHKLVVDPYAADVVRLIFSLKLDGMSSIHIADRLNTMGILPPMAYKRSIGINYNSGFRGGDEPGWTHTSVNRILRNEIYTGVMVQGRYKKPSHRIKKCVMVDEKDWVRVEGTHEAIISCMEFDLVQSLMKRDTCAPSGEENVYLFSGFLKCGRCGQNMIRTRSGGRIYYICCAKKGGSGCPSGRISETTLMRSVLGAISRQAKLLTKAEEILKSAGGGACAASDVHRKQLAELDREVERFRDLKAGLNQDLRDGIISREEFSELNSRFSRHLDEAERKREALEAESAREDEQNFPVWLAGMKKYREITGLDRKVLTFLVDEIVVIDRETIEIHFRFADEISRMLELAGMDEAELPSEIGGVL